MGAPYAMPYDQLLLKQNLGALSLWPKLGCVFHVTTAAQHVAGGCSTGHTVISIAFFLCLWGIHKATTLQSTRLLRGFFLLFGFLQMAFYLNYLRRKDTINNVHLYLDTATNLYTVTPQLVMGLTGLPIEAYVLFIGGHVVAASLLYFHIAKMSWYFAVLRALGIHTLTMSAALIVHKRARDFMRSSHSASQKQYEQQQLCQQDEGPGKSTGANQSSMAAVHPPLSTQIVLWPAISTKVVGRLIAIFNQGRSTLRTYSPAPRGAQTGSVRNRELKGDLKIAQQQAPHTQAQAEPRAQQEQQQQQQQQQAQAPAKQEEQQLVKQQQQQQQHTPAQVRAKLETHQAQQQQQQQHSTGASGRSSSAADQEQVLRGHVDHMQQSASKLRAKKGPSRSTSASSYPSTRPTRQVPGVWTPALQKAISEAAHVLAERRSQKPYTTNVDVTSPDPNETLRSLQEACRFVLKLNGTTTPDHIPEGGLTQLQRKLQTYQCLAPAVRSGCLVISYDTAPFGPGCTLEEMSKEVLPEAKEWAQEQGLLEPGEDLLTVQACRSTYWDSALDGQPSPVYCMAVHTPFLVPNPDSSTPASSTQEQPFQQQDNHAETGQAMRKQGHAEFELTIYAPNTDLELRGWQGSTDAPEDLPDAVKSRSLCLLATLGGQFLGVTVKEERPSRNEERVVQVCVRLPADSLDAGSGCPQPLMLELWAAGTLVCCYSALLVTLSSTSAGAAALAELQGWAAGLTGTHPEDSGPFTRDLVRWLRFQACSQQEQQASIAAKDADLLDGPMQQQQQQQLELMKAVGVGLLEYSLSQGMEGVAGLLLERFASFPFCIPPLILLDTLSAVRPEDQPCAPPASTLHSSSQHNDTLHSCPSPAAPAPCTPSTAAPATTPSSALICATAALSAVYRKLAAVIRDLHEQIFKEDAEYRAWSNAQVAPLARSWCRVWVLGICVGALRMALTASVPPIQEISSWAPVLLGYTAGSIFIRPGSLHSEVILAAISAARSCFGFMLGFGVLPVSETNKLLLGLRSEVPAEILMMAVMERVRMNWMVPLRALLAVSTWLVYVRMGLPCPATQSVLVNLCSLGVTAAMERRYRRLYASPRLHAKQQACGASPCLQAKQPSCGASEQRGQERSCMSQTEAALCSTLSPGSCT